MAKIKVKGINELAKRLNANLRITANKLFRDKSLREQIGVLVVKDIKANVDLGSAKSSTIKTREYLEKYNSTDSAYKKSRIKALFTGQLLKDLETNVKSDTNNFSFDIEQSDKKHTGYKTKNGRTKKVSFSKLSEYLIDDMGYNYLKLSDKAKTEITKIVRDKFYKLLS